MCGPAFTVRYALQEASGGRFADFLDEVPPHAVVAIDNAGRMDCSVWGDTLTLFAVTNQFAGTVVDGVCRDIDGTREHAYPMFARGIFMRTGKNRVVIETIQAPISLATIPVRSGDLLFGDETGVVAIPADRVEEVLSLAHQTVRRDEAVAAAIRNGASLIEAWRAGGPR
jgi:regulator of RNase E activity RraA